MVMMKRVPPSKQLNVRLTDEDQRELAIVMGKGWAWTPSDAVKRALIIAARTSADDGFRMLSETMKARGAARAEEARRRKESMETMAELRALDMAVPPVERSEPEV